MAKVEMSVHEALAKLKMFNRRIAQMENRQECNSVVGIIRNCDKTINGRTLEEFTSNAQAVLQRYDALIENYSRLKAAIVASNAVTKVQIVGKTYTVAEAIERKSLMNHKNSWKNLLQSRMNSIIAAQNEKENAFQCGFERFLNSQGDAKNRKPDEIEVLRKFYSENNGTQIYDPCNVSEIINSLNEEYEAFITEVDFRLSESNAVTKIIVDFID